MVMRFELLSCLNFRGGGGCSCGTCCRPRGDLIPFVGWANMGILDPWFCDIFEFCDLDEEVEDEEGNGDGTDGNPIVFGGAA